MATFIWDTTTIWMEDGGGGGTPTPAEITIQDEGVDVNTTTDTINFVGADVQAENAGTKKVNVYIPPQTFSSHFNTSDGNTDASISDITTTLRNVSEPISGNFDIGDWVSGSQNPCTRTATFVYSTPSSFSLLDATTSFYAILYGANDTTFITSTIIRS